MSFILNRVEHDTETFDSAVSCMKDLGLGDLNLPISGVVFGLHQADNSTMLMSLMLKETDGIAVKIASDLWEKEWSEKVQVGNVVEFEGNVISGSSTLPYVVITKSKPTLLSPHVFQFKRTEPPTEATHNSMHVVEVYGVYPRKKTSKEKAPTVVSLQPSTAQTKFYLKCFGGEGEKQAESIHPQMVLHIGPVRVIVAEHNSRVSMNLHPSVSTVIHISNNSDSYRVNNHISRLEDLNHYNTGDKITFEGFALKDCVDGSTFLINRIPYDDGHLLDFIRVGVINCPPLPEIKKGDGVKVEAIVYKYDVIRLKCINIVIDQRPEDSSFLMKRFCEYKPIHIPPPTPLGLFSPSNSISSQSDDDQTPRSSKGVLKRAYD